MTTRLSDIPEHASLIAKLNSVATLEPRDAAALLRLPVKVRDFQRDDDIVREHERPSSSTLLLQGLITRYKTVPDGKRQIMAFHVPGDIPDLQSLHLRTMDHSIGALRPARVAMIDHEPLREVIYGSPTLCHILWRDTLVDAAIHREWMMGIGRLSAHSRIAHLLCELLVKYRAAKLADGYQFPLMITQVDIADALGLTSVHVNRVLQDLRREGFVELDRSQAKILDWERFRELAAFDPTYLHVRASLAT
jgi:CRP-like cAMP-binding protein